MADLSRCVLQNLNCPLHQCFHILVIPLKTPFLSLSALLFFVSEYNHDAPNHLIYIYIVCLPPKQKKIQTFIFVLFCFWQLGHGKSSQLNQEDCCSFSTFYGRTRLQNINEEAMVCWLLLCCKTNFWEKKKKQNLSGYHTILMGFGGGCACRAAGGQLWEYIYRSSKNHNKVKGQTFTYIYHIEALKGQ